MAAIAPIACSVRVEMARPIAPSAAIAAATYNVTNSSRSSPSASGTVAPDSRVTGPTGNSAGADSERDRGHDDRRAQREHHDRGELDREQPGPPGRDREQVAQRPVAGLAGHRVPGHHRHHDRQDQDEQGGLSAMKARNTPLPASWLKNATPGPLPPPCGCGAATRSAIPMTTGNTTVTASSSRFRLRRKTSRSSAPSSRSQARAGLRAVRAPGAGRRGRVSRRHRNPPR